MKIYRRNFLSYLVLVFATIFGVRRLLRLKTTRVNSIQGTKRTEGATRPRRGKPLPLIERAFSPSPGVVASEDGTYTFKVHELGELLFPSGALVAADALVTPDRPPFETQIPTGRYRVLVAIKELLTDRKPGYVGDQRVAYAKLIVKDEPAVQWLLATTANEDARKLEKDEYYGYPVDAGIGSFMDAKAASILCQSQPLSDQLLSDLNKHDVHTWSWANLVVDPPSKLNVIAFSSGYGDGLYPSYFGLNKKGKVVCVVTDFMIIDDTDH